MIEPFVSFKRRVLTSGILKVVLFCSAFGLTAAAAPVGAQEAATAPVDTKEEVSPVEINGDQVVFSIEENKVVAEGNVSVVRGDVHLYCDRLEYDRTNKTADAKGRVVIIRNGERLTGDEMHFNLDTMTGTFTNGKFFSNPFYGAGAKIRRIDENHLVIEKGYITTSDFDKPEYRLYSNHVDIYPGQRAVARNVRLLAGKIPMMYLPKYTQDLREKEPAVIWTPGYDKDWGAFLLSRWRYHLSENIKGNINVDYRARRGLAEGLDAQYKTDSYGEGLIRTYYMNERRTDSKQHLWEERRVPTVEKERFKAEWRHKWQIDPQTDAILQYYKLSDSLFLKDYFEKEYEEQAYPETYFLLTRALPKGTMSLQTVARVNRFESKVERLPELSYSLPGAQLLGSNFYLANTTTYSNLTQKSPSPSEIRQKTMRLYNDSEVSYPFKLGFVELRPFAGGSQTYYSRTKDPSEYHSIRGVFRTGADLSTKFFRVFNTTTNFLGLDIHRMRHVITPSIAYKYVNDPSMAAADLDQFDGIDGLTRSHALAFTLENKLQTRRNGVEWDLLRMILGSDFKLKEDLAKGGFNNVTADIEAKPYSWLSLFFDSEYDTVAERLKSANVDFYVKGEEDPWYLRLGKRYHVDVDDLLTTEFGWRFNPKWKLRTYQRYDLQTGSLKEQEYGLQRDLHSWLVEWNFNQTRGEGSEIWLVFTLKAFPEIGLDLTTSFNKRKAGTQDLGASPE